MDTGIEQHNYQAFVSKLKEICGHDTIEECIDEFYDRPQGFQCSTDECLGGSLERCICGHHIKYPSHWTFKDGRGYIIVGSVCVNHFYKHTRSSTRSLLVQRTLDEVNNIKRKEKGKLPNGVCVACYANYGTNPVDYASKKPKRTTNTYTYNGAEHFMHIKCGDIISDLLLGLNGKMKLSGIPYALSQDPISDIQRMQTDLSTIDSNKWKRELDSLYISITSDEGPVDDAKKFKEKSEGIVRGSDQWYQLLIRWMDKYKWILSHLNDKVDTIPNDYSRSFIVNLTAKSKNGKLTWTPKQLRYLLKVYNDSTDWHTATQQNMKEKWDK